MVEIQEMDPNAVEELLGSVGYGHLGCSMEDQPYVVPIHYSYRKPYVYIYTTDGRKSEILRSNPLVCLQVESVVSEGEWRSVVLTGVAERLGPVEREEAMKAILADHPSLAPAISLRWRDHWVRENVEVIYRIEPNDLTGREAVYVETLAAIASGAGKPAQVL